MSTSYKIFDTVSQKYLSVRQGRKATWGCWPGNALEQLSEKVKLVQDGKGKTKSKPYEVLLHPEGTLEVHRFVMSFDAKLDANKNIIKPVIEPDAF